MNRFFKRIVTMLLLAAPALAFAQRPVGDLQAEFTMPIYRNEKAAALTVVIPENGPKEARVEFFNPEGNLIRTETYKLKPGTNNCPVKKIGGLAEGRYTAMILATPLSRGFSA